MDTGTHVVMGIALGGLATLDPVVAQDAVHFHSVLIATVLGSQAPDIDTLLKFKNNAVYIRNHRGITHSLPAVLLWPLAITAVLSIFFPGTDALHLWLWSFLAVFLHVFVDIFNAYGTQALRPFSYKWIALGVINTFDPFIFIIHVAGIAAWLFGAQPGPTFLVMYIFIFLYYIARFKARHDVKKAVLARIPDAERIIISPTIHFHQWKIAVRTKDAYYVAFAFKSAVTILDKFKRLPVPENKILEVAKQDKNLSAFLSFSPVYNWQIKELDNGWEVRFTDLRYRKNGHYPFVAVVKLNEDLEIIGSYTGWIFNKEKLKKKLDIVPR
ncbi:metal-dependent hydrolase [Heyndrickxia coagulans]|uniref:metal-dependent hydrolase n=1 Tax=Heyndrickxia coagulans TaxID=1398 RepID=UPI001060BAAB|nr:metal-dependent hydrolase [Heyndrickxia coagulans]MBF8417670.1 metal-dependent hydrolase [Heyndrickxia coagulans]MED4942141.1 metal-dependent hydrolase [Heyndrickxia coagulans]